MNLNKNNKKAEFLDLLISLASLLCLIILILGVILILNWTTIDSTSSAAPSTTLATFTTTESKPSITTILTPQNDEDIKFEPQRPIDTYTSSFESQIITIAEDTPNIYPPEPNTNSTAKSTQSTITALATTKPTTEVTPAIIITTKPTTKVTTTLAKTTVTKVTPKTNQVTEVKTTYNTTSVSTFDWTPDNYIVPEIPPHSDTIGELFD